MIVVCDTTAITNLFQIGEIRILQAVFGEIIIPKAVENELAEIPEQLEYIETLEFIKVMTPSDIDSLTSLKNILDDGEAEAIALAKEISADFIIIDEWRGRKVAKEMGLSVIGVIGILLAAKRKGIVDEIKPTISRLVTDLNFRIHPDILANALREAGEE